MNARLILVIISLFTVCLTIAQEAPKVKFGKPSPEELQMTTYAPDSTADAVILYDDGQSIVNYDTSKSKFMLQFERFVRIKILKQEGTSWGNFLIPVYSNGKNQEQTTDVDSETFNMEGDKMVKSELKKESIFKERENNYWETVKLSLPNVKVGSVIDIRYRISSPLLWNLRTWKFQYTIPVKWSQYEVSFPEYFNYNKTVLGYHPLCMDDYTTKTQNINFTTTYETTGNGMQGGGQRQQVNQTISYLSHEYRYAAKDIPAMKEEPYMTTIENFNTRLKFELASTDFTKVRGEYKSYTNSWKNIVDQLLGDENFGDQIKPGAFSDDITEKLTAGKTTEMDEIVAIYDHVQHTIKWNNDYSAQASKPLRKSYSEKTGNVADINLTLLTLLRKAGISAEPVLLSTRSHGILNPISPTLSEFNYVIIQAIADGKPMLLDATEEYLPAGSIPFRCLNGIGILIRKDLPAEIHLTNNDSNTTTIVSLEIKEGKISGTMNSGMTGEDAFNFRMNLKSAGGSKEYFEKVKNNSSEIQYLDYSYSNQDSIYLPARKEYKFNLTNSEESNNSIIYLNPILSDRHQKNPFTSPTREFPVDFGSPFRNSYSMVLKIPEGYQVEELPKNKSFMVGNKDGIYAYQAVQMDGQIVVSTRLVFDKPIFLPQEYENLKLFYDMIVSKEAEQIILKKIN